MIKSEDLELVALLAEEASIAAVSGRLNLTPSAVSQRLASLEDRTGLVLAHRNGRAGIILTDDGEFLAEQAAEVLSRLNILQDELNDRRGVIGGTIKIVAPLGFGRRRIAPVLGQFSRANPDLLIDLQLADDLSHLPKDAWDILIRVAPLQDSSLVSRVLSTNKRLICATPAYVEQHGEPKHPHDLKAHRCISISEDGSKGATWAFRSREHEDVAVKIDPYLTTNDGETALDWAMEGLGVVMRSEWSAAPMIKAKRLIDVTPKGWSALEAPIVALTTPRNLQSARISKVLHHLAANIGLGINENLS